MIWFYLAYILFMVGAALGVVERGSELSLWFVALGWVLNLSLLLLLLLRTPYLIRRKLTLVGILTHSLAMLAIPTLLYYRAAGDKPLFTLLLAGSVLSWSISMVALDRQSPKNVEANY